MSPAVCGQLLSALLCSAAAQPPQPILAEAWVQPPTQLQDPGPALRRAQASFADGRDGTRIRIIAPAAGLSLLRAEGFEVRITRPDHRRPPAPMPAYRDADEMLQALEALAEEWPGRAELVDLGVSCEGRPLVGLRMGEGDYRVRLLAGHHGDELASAEVALELARRILQEEVAAEVWVLPHVNPDGIEQGSRYNARQVDLNRNYDYQWSEGEVRGGEHAFSEPESRAVRVLSAYRSFGTGLSFHAGAELICYVWNYSSLDSPDETLLLEQAQVYDALCSLDDFYVINGADWYVTHGDSTDWSYGRQGTLDYTVEVSQEKAPAADALDALVQAQLDPALDFLRWEPSIVGLIMDAEDGVALEASVTPSQGWPSLAGPDGRFARWMEPGLNELTVSAPGYRSQTLELDVEQGVTAKFEILLERESLLDLRPETPLLSWGDEPRALRLGGLEDDSLELWRPGFDSLQVKRVDDGYQVTTSALEPGAWGIRSASGELPRAFFVGERSDRVRLQDLSWEDQDLVLQGQGFGRGSRAWALAGTARAMTPLEVFQLEEGVLRLDASAAADLPDPLDLLLVSDGAQLAAADIRGALVLDTATPSDTGLSGDSEPSSSAQPGTRGCSCSMTHAAPLARLLHLVTLASLLAGRRRNLARRHVSE